MTRSGHRFGVWFSSIAVVLAVLAVLAVGPAVGRTSGSPNETVLPQADPQSASLAAVDRRPIICHVAPKLVHTQWHPGVAHTDGPLICTGGANRLGAGYIRYLSTSAVLRPHPRLRG